MKNGIVVVALILGGMLLVACGGSGEQERIATPISSDEQISQSVQQTVAALSVAQTVEALAQNQPTTAPTLPATDPPATSVVEPTDATPPTAQPEATTPPTTQPPPTEAAAATCAVVSDVNLRPGPGTVYGPVIAAMRANTQLVPLAYSPVGFPQGPWLFAQIMGTEQNGWVSARPQYILCNVDFNDLPLATNIPPTPLPPPTAQPAATATTTTLTGPPNIDNDAPGGSFPEDGTVTFNIITDPTFLFRMDVRDLTVGNFEGAGIESVEFSISGNGVDYFRREGTAGFCVFGGGEPICNPWPRNELGQYTWGQGGQVVESGDYFINMAVTAEREDEEFFGSWNWNFDFRVTLP